jgi:excisionase family DNA binding protein
MSFLTKKSDQNQFCESGTSPTAGYANLCSQAAFNIPQAAIYAGVKSSAIEEVVRDGRLPGRRLGRNIIVLKADLDSFLASLSVISPHVPPSIVKRRERRDRTPSAPAANS